MLSAGELSCYGLHAHMWIGWGTSLAEGSCAGCFGFWPGTAGCLREEADVEDGTWAGRTTGAVAAYEDP